MDILSPPLVNIDGRIYCKYHTEKNTNLSDELPSSSLSKDVDVTWDGEPVCTTSHDTGKSSGIRSKLHVDIPSVFFKYVIGNRGDTKRRLERETNTRIQIPSRGVEGDIIITGPDMDAVNSAKDRIDLIVSAKRWKETFTHFISIPLNSNNVKVEFDKFEENILHDFPSDEGVNKSLFQNPDKLHLTICTLVVLNNDEVEKAKSVLRRCYDDIVSDVLGESPLEITVSDLEYMNDDPAAVDVLYAKVRCLDDSDRLQVIASRLSEAFMESGLSERKYDRVKLHCTLMNTTFRKKFEKEKQQRTRKTFDASNILIKYQDFSFGSLIVKEIHLSKRFGTSSNGYYCCTDKIVL